MALSTALAAIAVAGGGEDVAAQQGMLTTITQDMREREYAEIRGKVLAAADVMPADHYDYRAAPDIRSFAEELNHTADVNFRLCGMASGEARPPGGAQSPRAAVTKVEIIARVTDSFELCDATLDGMTDETARTRTSGRYIRASHVTAMLGHTWHGYGKLTLMMRLNGIAPAPPG